MSNFAEGILYKESVSQAWDTIKGQINTNKVTKVISGAGNSRQTESIMSPKPKASSYAREAVNLGSFAGRK